MQFYNVTVLFADNQTTSGFEADSFAGAEAAAKIWWGDDATIVGIVATGQTLTITEH